MEDQIILRCRILRKIFEEMGDTTINWRGYNCWRDDSLVNQLKGREIWIRSSENVSIFVYTDSISIYTNNMVTKTCNNRSTIYFENYIESSLIANNEILDVLDKCINRMRTRFYVE